MANKYYVDTTFEEEETPSSTKVNQLNERIKAGFQLISNALVDMTGDDKVIDDVGRTDELKVTASSPSDMTVHVAIGLACVDGQICQVDAPVDKTIVAPTTNPRYTIVQLTEDGEVETKNGTEAASPSEPDADADAIKLAAIYLPANTTQIDDSDMGYGYIIDRREWPTVILGTGGNVGINTTHPDARLDVLETSGAQLRLTHTDGVKFVDFTLDTNHDLTVKPSSVGQIKLQPTTDSVDFFQVLDADGGTPILNIDSDNERVGIKNAAPTYDLDVTGKARISSTLGVGMSPSDSVGLSVNLTGAGKQMLLRLGNSQTEAAGVGAQLLFQVGSGLATMATVDGVCAGSNNDDGYMTLGTRKTDVVYERVRITEDGYVGINTTGPDARLDVLETAGAQLRLTHTDGSKFVDFTLDTNHDLTIKPSSIGQIKLQPTTDSVDFFQVLDADGGTPILNVDSDNERVGIGTATPSGLFHVYGAVWGRKDYFWEFRGTPDPYSGGVRYDTYGAETLIIAVGHSSSRIMMATGHNVRTDPGISNRLPSSPEITIVTGNVGINTTGPDRRLDVLDDTDPQLRLTQADGSVYTDFKTDSNGDLSITPSGDEVIIPDTKYLNAETGRAATYIVAANDSETVGKKQADYKCDGTADEVDIAAAISAGTPGTIVLLEGTYNIADSFTVPLTVTLKFMNGAKLNIASTKTVTFNGQLEAGLHQIFSGSGTAVINKGSVEKVYAQWWGAKGDGSTDDTDEIQAAIDCVGAAGGGKVFFVPGTYNHTGLTVLDHYVTLEGASERSCKLDHTASTGNAITLGDATHSPDNFTLLRLYLYSSGGSSGAGISSTLTSAQGSITSFYIAQFFIQDFDNGIILYTPLHGYIGEGRIHGNGHDVSGSLGMKLGDRTDSVGVHVTISGVYISSFERAFHNSYCPEVVMLRPAFESSGVAGTIPATKFEEPTTIIQGHWEANYGLDVENNGSLELLNTNASLTFSYPTMYGLWRLRNVPCVPSRNYAYRTTSAQSIPTGTDTKVQLNAESMDIYQWSKWDVTTDYDYTIPFDGFYLFFGRVQYTDPEDGKQYIARIKKGSTVIAETAVTASGTSALSIVVIGFWACQKDDVITLYTEHDSTGAENIATGMEKTCLVIASF